MTVEKREYIIGEEKQREKTRERERGREKAHGKRGKEEEKDCFRSLFFITRPEK